MNIPEELITPQMKRYLWIHNRKEPFGRKDIQDTFGVSPITASRDVAEYRIQNPKSLRFNYSTRRYVKKDI